MTADIDKIFSHMMAPIKTLAEDIVRYTVDMLVIRKLNPAHMLIAMTIAVTSAIKTAKATGNMPPTLRIGLAAFLEEALTELEKP